MQVSLKIYMLMSYTTFASQKCRPSSLNLTAGFGYSQNTLSPTTILISYSSEALSRGSTLRHLSSSFTAPRESLNFPALEYSMR